ncbi:hypothetical protein EYR40_007667 [Pleurotus pulmonarius]|nr:hypothetical protein EYR38_008031 [Pleurotus pulmonarius]KAF4597215.1 hypothetical protein EYR40_007667 [Pleurotus pulmonarius]
MVHSKTVVLAAALATAVVAVPSSGETNQFIPNGEANLIEAREPMLPPPGGFEFHWRGGHRPQIIAGLAREVDDETLSSRMFIPPYVATFNRVFVHISDAINTPPVGWMSPWWNGKPVGSAPLPRPGQKRGEDDHGLEAREPIPPRPLGHRWSDARHSGMRFRIVSPAPTTAGNHDEEGLEAREHYSNGRYDTTKGPLPAYIPPNVRELFEERGMPFQGFRNGPPVGWASPWWKGKPVGMARDVHEEELEAREPIMMNPNAPRPPAGWKSPWFHGRPVGDLRLREADGEELETRDYDMDELD